MAVTVTINYSVQGLPDTVITFNLTGTDIEDIKTQMQSKKKILDKEHNLAPQNSHISVDPSSLKVT